MKKLMIVSESSKTGHQTCVKYDDGSEGAANIIDKKDDKISGLTTKQAEEVLNYAAKKLIFMDAGLRQKMQTNLEKQTAELMQKKNKQQLLGGLHNHKFKVSTNNNIIKEERSMSVQNPYNQNFSHVKSRVSTYFVDKKRVDPQEAKSALEQ
jgi:hypothetical protein